MSSDTFSGKLMQILACKLGAANAGACVNYGLIPYCLNVPENWDKGLPNKINYKI